MKGPECNLSVSKAFSRENNFGDHRGIGHNHRNRPEHGFEVVGQLCSPGISRIHCDENTACINQVDFTAWQYYKKNSILIKVDCFNFMYLK